MGMADDFAADVNAKPQMPSTLSGKFASDAQGGGVTPIKSSLASAYPNGLPSYNDPDGVKAGNLLYGAAKGAADLVQGPAQLLLNGAASLTGSQYLKDKASQYNQYLANQEKNYQNDTQGSMLAGVGRVGSGAAPFLASGGASGGMQVPAAVRAFSAAAPRLSRAAGLAGQGALSGILQPDTSNPQSTQDFLTNKAAQSGIAAGTALGIGGLSSAASRLINPHVDPDVQMLINNGITPTPGQILGGGFKTTEEKATSIPVVGDMIRNAQRRALDQFNTAALNRSGVGATTGGQEGVGQAQDYFTNAYGDILSQMTHSPDLQFEHDVLNAAARNRVGANGMNELTGMMQQNYVPKFANNQNNVPTMSGPDIKDFQQQLRNSRNQFSRSQDPIDQRVGDAYGDISQAFRDSLSRQNHPDLVGQLNDLDRQYAAFKQYQNASLGAAASRREGQITPADYLNSIKSGSRQTGNTGTFSNGGAMNQDFANAANNVLGNVYPDSGTAGRGMVGVLAAGGAGALTHPVATGAAALGGAAATLPYTNLGQRAAAALLAGPRPAFVEPVTNAIGYGAPIIGTAMVNQASK